MDLLQGFSVAFMLAALGMGAVDLVVARERAGLLKRVALVNVIWLGAMTADSLRYFFVVPTSSLILALVIFCWCGGSCRPKRHVRTLPHNPFERRE